MAVNGKLRMSDDNYLTIARVMAKAKDKWTRENLSNLVTGETIIHAKQAYTDGFLAGVTFKFTGETYED